MERRMHVDREGVHPSFFRDFEDPSWDKSACQMYQHIDSSKVLNDPVDAIAACLGIGDIERHKSNVGLACLHKLLAGTFNFCGSSFRGNHNLCAPGSKFLYSCGTNSACAARN